MRKETELSRIFNLMLLLNLSIVLFYSLICFVTINRICASFGAYEFLSTFQQLPRYPWRIPVESIGLFLLLALVSVGKFWWDIQRFHLRVLVCVLEIALCVGLIAALDFYYSGVALLVLADLAHYVQNRRFQMGFIVVLAAVFAFGRGEILFPAGGRIEFSAYLSYYDRAARSWFSGIESTMSCLNILLFVLFMILLFTGQKAENARIRKLNEQLNQANDQLRDYAVNMERMTEIRERNRLAREIHDTLGHTLTGIIMGADAGLALFDAAPEESKRRIEVVAQSARDGLNEVRRSIKALRPDALERFSLAEALETLVDNFQTTTSAEIDYRQEAGPLEFAADEEDTLYRVVQESMTNAVRHGHADRIAIRLTRTGDIVTISVRDNGSGSGKTEEGFGLRHMRERLELLGGSFTYGNLSKEAEDGYTGFFITVNLPVRSGKEEQA